MDSDEAIDTAEERYGDRLWNVHDKRGHRVAWVLRPHVDPDTASDDMLEDDDSDEFYVDTGELATYERPCAACGLVAGEDGPDPCIGTIPGVDYACCGHGDPTGAYIGWSSGSTSRGSAACVRDWERRIMGIQPPARNELCPCGSGRKYKRCHGGS
jgi:hypothetical protein